MRKRTQAPDDIDRAILREIADLRTWYRIEYGATPRIVGIDGKPVEAIPDQESPVLTSLILAERVLGRRDDVYMQEHLDAEAVRRFRKQRRRVHNQLVRESERIMLDGLSLTLKVGRLNPSSAYISRVSIWLCVRALLVASIIYIWYPELAYRVAPVLIARLQVVARGLPLNGQRMAGVPSA